MYRVLMVKIGARLKESRARVAPASRIELR